LGERVSRILEEYFRDNISPGILVYEEFLLADRPLDRTARQEVAPELERARQLMKRIATMVCE
jgi:hypothetical protein